MLDDLPWLYDSYIFHLTSRTLSLIQFDQIYQFGVSPLFHFNFNHEEAIPIKLQSLIQLYQYLFHLGQPCLCQDKIIIKIFILCPDVFLSWPYICVVLWSQIDLTLQLHSLIICVPKMITHISQRGANVCTLKWSPRLWAPILQFINLLN